MNSSIPFQNLFKSLIFCSLLIALTQCSNLRFPGVYKIDVAQGNIVTQDLLDKLQPGMSVNQVKYILGAPLIQDTFNENRWDYYYSLKSGRQDSIKTSRVTVYFSDKQYQRYELIGEIKQSSIRREAKEEVKEDKKFLGIF